MKDKKQDLKLKVTTALWLIGLLAVSIFYISKQNRMRQNSMKKIWYTVVEEMEVPDDMDEDEIDNKIKEIAGEKEYLWSENNDLLDMR